MSYVVSYKAKGLKLDATVFKLFNRTVAEIQEIATLKELSEDVMTVKQSKKLESLQKESRTIIYNGLTITTKGETEEPEAALYYDMKGQKVYIQGHEGNDLTFNLDKEKTFYTLKNGYFDDNYDGALGPVQDTIKAFRCTGSIEYESDEGDSGEDVETMYYKDGLEVEAEKV